MDLSPGERTRMVIEAARSHGFHRVGITGIQAPERLAEYQRWLKDGLHGEMHYMASADHRRCRADPRELLSSARSIISVALAHDMGVVPTERLTRALRGQIARYAQRSDYHWVLKDRLKSMAEQLGRDFQSSVTSRACVDSAPVLERELAERSGLGFVGKNTMVIAPGVGSYLLLGELLIDADLEETRAPVSQRGCGSCTACLDACPTGAFRDPFVLDARLCISYLTIELRGPIPRHLRAAIGNRIFGCDVCQEVCPFNSAAPQKVAIDLQLRVRDEDLAYPDLLELLDMGSAKIKRFVGNTPLARAGRIGLVRNACVALGNLGDPRAIEPLSRRLKTDSNSIIRGHAAWALGRLRARSALLAARPGEQDSEVLEEIDHALAQEPPAGS